MPRGGTAGFLCPEQISDVFGPVTERSDVYGLGGLLYALLTGHPPMSGRDLPETLANVLSLLAPVPPSAFDALSAGALDDVVLRCLRKEPTERYPDARERGGGSGRDLACEPAMTSGGGWFWSNANTTSHVALFDSSNSISMAFGSPL